MKLKNETSALLTLCGREEKWEVLQVLVLYLKWYLFAKF